MVEMMKVAIAEAYGNSEVIHIREKEKPVLKHNEVLVGVYVSTVSSADSRLRRGDPFLIRIVLGFLKPRKNILGTAFSGVVSSVGDSVTLFKVGDQVFGSTEFDLGAHAEYVRLKESGPIAHKPESVPHEKAVLLPFGFTTSHYFLKKAGVKKGDNLLVVGAGGTLGSAAVMLAKNKGVVVTGLVGTHTIPHIADIGLDHVINYEREDVSKKVASYDVVFDTTGKIPLSVVRTILKKEGVYVSSVHMNIFRIIHGLCINLFTKKKIKGGVYTENKKDILELLPLLARGDIKPLTGQTFLFQDIRKAHDYTDSKEKVGNTLLKIKI